MHHKLIRAAIGLLMFAFCPMLLLSQDSVKIYADPENAPSIKASKFVDSIDFIPLETNKESKYNQYNWLIVAKNHFAIMDKATNAIFIFDKKGKFVYKFKNDKSRYKINSVQYVASENALLIISYNDNYTISNSKKLQLIKRWKDKDISRYVSVEWVYLNKELTRKPVFAPSYVLNNNITYFDSGFIYRNYIYDKYERDSIAFRLIQYGADYKIKHKYFPFFSLPKMWSYYEEYALSLSVGSILNKNAMLFQLDYSPILYELQADTIIERYRFVFPMTNVMPADFNSLRFDDNIDFQKYKEKNNKAISYFYDMLEHGKYLFFGVTRPDDNSKAFLLMDNMVYSLDKLTSDSSICNLPPDIFTSISQQDMDYVYTITSADEILQQKANLIADPHVSLSFKNYLNKMTKNDNHIVIRVKLK